MGDDDIPVEVFNASVTVRMLCNEVSVTARTGGGSDVNTDTLTVIPRS